MFINICLLLLFSLSTYETDVVRLMTTNKKKWQLIRLTCAWQYFGTLIFELFFEIIWFYVDNINFLFLC